VFYILDEPSIGLHQRDNDKLFFWSDIGNSVIVVEHDKDMIERADYVIDIGKQIWANNRWARNFKVKYNYTIFKR
jgi:excinuclease UvrABC ATPase subunit